jgi:hypothetical protein
LKNYRATSTHLGFALLAAILCWSAPVGAQDSCQPLYDALTKLASTPSHSYARLTNPGGPPRNFLRKRSKTGRTAMPSASSFVPIQPKDNLPACIRCKVKTRMRKKTCRSGFPKKPGCPCAKKPTSTCREALASGMFRTGMNTATFALRCRRVVKALVQFLNRAIGV